MKALKKWPASAHFPAALSIRWDEIDESMQNVRKEGMTCISINAEWGWKKGKNIDFLEKYPWIEGVSIADGIIDISVLNKLHSLKWLHLAADKNKGDLNFSNFPDLLSLFCIWNELQYSNLDKCDKCQALQIHKVPWTNLQNIKSLRNLRHLEINYGKIESLQGVEGMHKLCQLNLYSLPNLQSLSDLNTIADNVLSLSIQKCKNIGNYEAVKKMLNIEKLLLSESAPIDSVSFFGKLNKLKYGYVGVEILDGNTAILKQKGVEFKRQKIK